MYKVTTVSTGNTMFCTLYLICKISRIEKFKSSQRHPTCEGGPLPRMHGVPKARLLILKIQHALTLQILQYVLLIFIYYMILCDPKHFQYLFWLMFLARVFVIFQQAPKIFPFNCSRLTHE